MTNRKYSTVITAEGPRRTVKSTKRAVRKAFHAQLKTRFPEIFPVAVEIGPDTFRVYEPICVKVLGVTR